MNVADRRPGRPLRLMPLMSTWYRLSGRFAAPAYRNENVFAPVVASVAVGTVWFDVVLLGSPIVKSTPTVSAGYCWLIVMVRQSVGLLNVGGPSGEGPRPPLGFTMIDVWLTEYVLADDG